jgi:hypothetical protein
MAAWLVQLQYHKEIKMAVQLINIGNVANDGTGDDLREAFIKVNQNFEELDLRDDEQTTASNLGDIGQGIFFQRLNYDLQFKKISAGANITLTADDDKIVIVADSGVSDLTITADTGSVLLDNSAALTIAGGANISTIIVDGTLTVDYTGVTDLASDTTPQLSADLDAQSNNLLNVGTISSSGISGPLTGDVTGNVTGNVTGLVYGIDIRTINTYFDPNAIDLGAINPVITNLIDFLIYNTDIDWGTFAAPNTATLDLGTL